MKLMIIIFVFSLCMILILELQSMYIVRRWVVSIIPILNGRREFFSNFFIGMFSTGLLGVPTAFLDYHFEKENFLNERKPTFPLPFIPPVILIISPTSIAGFP